jgi:hypothetical protein
MKRFRVFNLIVVLFLSACATTREGTMEISPEVEKSTTAGPVLFRDLLSKPGGVGFVDYTLYPRSYKKRFTRIEVLTPYDNVKTGEERWFITDEHGQNRSYLVRLIPDGRGGTTFTVRHEQNATTKSAQ